MAGKPLAECVGHAGAGFKNPWNPAAPSSAGLQVAFSWANGPGPNSTAVNTTSPGVCQVDGDGISLTVKPGKAGTHTLSLYAGAQAGSHNISATLRDGGKSSAYTEELTAVAADMANHLWINVRWDLMFNTTSADAVVAVRLAAKRSNGHYVAPLPPPPLPACAKPLCGSLAPLQPDARVDLGLGRIVALYYCSSASHRIH